MDIDVDRINTVFKAIIHECKVEQITFMAGSIAYNAFISILPLLFLMLAIVSAIGGGGLETNLITITQSVVTPGLGELLATELRNVSAGASIVGFLVLAWGMLRIFRILDMAFSDIYETESENTFTNQLKDSVIVFSSIGTIVLGAAVLEAMIGISNASGLLWYVQRIFLFVVIAFGLFPMYYLFPDEPGIKVIEVIPGLLFTTIALIIFQSLFSLYTQFSSQLALNNLLGSILVFLTWLYFNGLVILIGAAINAVLSNRSEDVNIEPVVGGIPKTNRDFESVNDIAIDERLHQMRGSLEEASELQILVDGNTENYILPAPDYISVDTTLSSPSALNETVDIELKWASDQVLAVNTDGY